MTQQLETPTFELQVIWNRLISVVEEQGKTLMHTAFSAIVRESGDISAGFFDEEGRMLAQAVTGTPGHINTMAASVKYFLNEFPLETMEEGDIYLTNDPWKGTGHLNDFVLVKPSFYNGRAVGLFSCTSHLVDLGGLGMGPDGSDVFDEGLIIPPMKLIDKGKNNETLMSLIRANSRAPLQNDGDIYALIACCDVGEARLIEMMDEFGLNDLREISEYIITVSRKVSEDAIREAPNGTYFNTMMVDGYDFEIKLVATLTIDEAEIRVDFEGTSGPSRFGINVPINFATAYAVFGLRCIFAPEVPNNAGSLEPFKVSGPKTCILNAQPPSPVAQRHIMGHLMPDLVLGCLRKAMPELVPAEGSSCMYDIPLRNSFETTNDPTKTVFTTELAHNGGTGARPGLDGLSATAYPSGVFGSQVEITESTEPLFIRRRELRPDSGGAGEFRGGLGQIIEISSNENAAINFFGSVDRMVYPARGDFGGKNGACGDIALESGKKFRGKGEQSIPANEVMIFQTPGGGGLGDPMTREPISVANDVRLGLVSLTCANNDYGVAVNEDFTVNESETAKLRDA